MLTLLLLAGLARAQEVSTDTESPPDGAATSTAAANAAVILSSSPKVRLPAEPAPMLLPPPGAPRHGLPPIRGVHMTGWAAGSSKNRREMAAKMKEAGLNAVVIALKETDGLAFVRGTRLGTETGAYVNAIPNLEAAVKDFKDAGIYTIGRVVLFKDDHLARKRPDLAVKKPDGSVWANDKGVAWVDPYKREVWEYNLAIASRAAGAGFDEIQLDYIRFPSDGKISLCRYSRADHSPRTAAENLKAFLKEAHARLKPMGVNISICVFGMTTTDNSGMGIGQHIQEMAREVDFISPMMYPSHYYKGEYGLKNPNKEPYKTIQYGIRDALARLGPEAWRLRPYFQDFSLGVKYTAEQVRAQVFASEKQGVVSWLMWNPQNKYTWSFTRHNNKPIFRELQETP